MLTSLQSTGSYTLTLYAITSGAAASYKSHQSIDDKSDGANTETDTTL